MAAGAEATGVAYAFRPLSCNGPNTPPILKFRSYCRSGVVSSKFHCSFFSWREIWKVIFFLTIPNLITFFLNDPKLHYFLKMELMNPNFITFFLMMGGRHALGSGLGLGLGAGSFPGLNGLLNFAAFFEIYKICKPLHCSKFNIFEIFTILFCIF